MLVTLVIAQIIFLSGVTSGKEEVKRGEKVVIMKNETLLNIKRVEVYEAGIDCKQQTEPICNWCSSEEMENGCPTKNCPSFLFNNGTENVSLTVLDASDGCYILQITANPVVKKEFVVVGQDQLISPAISPEPSSSRAPVESQCTEGTEPPEGGVKEGTAIIVVFIVVIIAVFIAVFIVIIMIIFFIEYCCKKKQQKRSDAGDNAGVSDLNITQSESISGGEQAAGDSLEMDEFLHSAEDDSLNNAVIHVLKAQESGRPGHNHIDDDDYSSLNCVTDKDDNCSSKNDYDSNYYSNDDSTY